MYKSEEAKCKSEDQRQLLFKKSILFLYFIDIYANHGTKLTMQVAVHTTTTTQLYLCLINWSYCIVVLSNQADGRAIHDYNNYSSKIVFFGEPF